ncbi:hypothetical protein [Chitinophaga japonensis]|uniref:GLPGLI family protein n=1 Tax=Chitinophaga japonensis TaxID=104662 RepID=A0A562SZP5_CHIJA|nr:hypothetical protein [Chitinophaga japonensis]TWI86474.1 GLPGLI family protein [Chitinophaga japonensis]
MYRTLMITAGLGLLFKTGAAQDSTQGKIHYEITYHLHAALKPDQQQYKDLVPESSTENAVLVYKGQRVKTFLDDAVDKEQDGVSTKITVSSSEGTERYLDLEKGILWWVNKAQEPPVLVEKKLSEAAAEEKVSESAGTRQILGYTCKKLVVKAKKGGTQTVWYTTALPVKAGSPIGVYTNRGVVLGLESRLVTLMATSVEFVPVTEKEVQPPADMKVVQQ